MNTVKIERMARLDELAALKPGWLNEPNTPGEAISPVAIEMARSFLEQNYNVRLYPGPGTSVTAEWYDDLRGRRYDVSLEFCDDGSFEMTGVPIDLISAPRKTS